MHGQWHGQVDEETYVNIEIDDCGSFYRGRGHFFGHYSWLAVCNFVTLDKSPTQDLSVDLLYEREEGSSSIPIEDLKKAFPDGEFPLKARLKLQITRKGLKATISTQLQAGIFSRTHVFSPSNSGKKSNILADRNVNSWKKFKAYVAKAESNQYIYRGQPVQKRLRSAFHRTNRKILWRYVNDDIPRLHRVLSANTKHFFNLSNPNENGSFWHIAQHHGYPTPLLDWSHSPYVAAYFAFRQKVADPEPKRKVRIFVFDARAWKADFRQFQSVENIRPHLSLMEPLALENPRALPQQALSGIATVDDVEGYVESLERLRKKKYLRAFDLPYSERKVVLDDLRLMGISSGALFPGLDGACEDMKMRMFDS